MNLSVALFYAHLYMRIVGASKFLAGKATEGEEKNDSLEDEDGGVGLNRKKETVQKWQQQSRAKLRELASQMRTFRNVDYSGECAHRRGTMRAW